MRVALHLLAMPPVAILYNRGALINMGADSYGAHLRPTFTELYADYVPKWLLDRAASLGFKHPTPVQEEALSTALAGHDAIIQAKVCGQNSSSVVFAH